MEKVMQEVESAGIRAMESELETIETQIRKTEEVILNKFSGASDRQMGILQEMAWFIDNGLTTGGCLHISPLLR